jgi:glyoxylase-like metal-dependent hydrolase (beta-lactamase superfamily II)
MAATLRLALVADIHHGTDHFTKKGSTALGLMQEFARFVADAKPDAVIDLGDRHFQVIHTPGHSPGGIALFETATGILFSGDVVYDGELIEGTTPREQTDYHASMTRLLALPVRVVHGGHFPSYDGARHRSIIRQWLDAKDAS